MNNVLEVNGICKIFGEKENQNTVLDNISFNIKPGEFVSIMGPSGCGKSTLLYILGGLLDASKGTVIFDGKDWTKLKDREMSKLRRNKLGFVFQFYNLVQNLTVEENILLPLVMDGKKIANYKEELDEILDIVGLKDKRKFIPSKLSGGQQQRVSIARAVIASPKIIMADEPIGNLDSKSGKEIMELFQRLNKEKGVSILQVTHSEESALYGSRIIRLFDGKILKDEILDDK
ncbi:MAG: ABC transporter ATP-binding protein [Clostridium sp.]|nr:ABC transporter ATP-binding protein [Clostridium sp.]